MKRILEISIYKPGDLTEDVMSYAINPRRVAYLR
jgi:hypothetical protein